METHHGRPPRSGSGSAWRIRIRVQKVKSKSNINILVTHFMSFFNFLRFSILAMIFLQNFSCFSFYPLEAKGGTLWSVYAMLWLVLSWLLPNGGGPGLLLMYPTCCGWCSSVGCYLMVADLDCSSCIHHVVVGAQLVVT